MYKCEYCDTIYENHQTNCDNCGAILAENDAYNYKNPFTSIGCTTEELTKVLCGSWHCKAETKATCGKVQVGGNVDAFDAYSKALGSDKIPKLWRKFYRI